MNFKPGDRIVLRPSASHQQRWFGCVGTILTWARDGTNIELDILPGFWHTRKIHLTMGMDWVQPFRDPTPLEIDLIAYIASEKLALGLS